MASSALAGKYCSVDTSLPWYQWVDLDIIYDDLPDDSQQCYLRYNDRKYAKAPTAVLQIEVYGDNIVSFETTFPHWIIRGKVKAMGEFAVTGRNTSLYLTQVGQGMTGQETWVTTLVKKANETSIQIPSTVPPSLARLIRSNFSAPNSQPIKTRLDALAISKNGKIVLEEYFGGMSASTQHIISSCTKSITAILAGIAINQGLFSLEDTIAKYFLDVPTT
ncbi:hypothetical protein SEUCBS139899_005590 [Sporothrix eucalyptigena]|uniref:Beta-lactamase-related domain-containing protein n=1 Tax=Sporothrix eucalyptigena TaxID=1812306 RepID=A0ABP0C303_9PEZI